MFESCQYSNPSLAVHAEKCSNLFISSSNISKDGVFGLHERRLNTSELSKNQVKEELNTTNSSGDFQLNKLHDADTSDIRNTSIY